MNRILCFRHTAVLIISTVLCIDASTEMDDNNCSLEILHPASGQEISAEWQDILLASISCRLHGTLVLYVDGQFVTNITSWPVAIMLPRLEDGQHALSLVLHGTGSLELAQDQVMVTYLSRPKVPSLFDFPLGFPPSLEYDGKATQSSRTSYVGHDERLHVIWTCPDWEVDWVTELLHGADVSFKVVFDNSFKYFAQNSLVVISQNDERNRPPDQVPCGKLSPTVPWSYSGPRRYENLHSCML